MAQGGSTRGIAHEFAIAQPTVSKIIHQVSKAIIDGIGREQIPVPNNEMWIQNAQEFEELGFPHAIRCLDGKHFSCKVNLSFGFMINQHFSVLRRLAHLFTTGKASIR